MADPQWVRFVRRRRQRQFDATWDRLAVEGACDGRGGAEYGRVRAEWVAAGRPDPEPFIRVRANVGPY